MGRQHLRRLIALGAGTYVVVALAGTAGAQNVDSLRRRFTIPTLSQPTSRLAGNVSRVTPGNSSGSPSAFGASLGEAFIGASYQNQERGSTLDDGAVVAGFGLGDPNDFVGIELAVTSFSTVRSGFGKRGGLSVKVDRVLPNQWGVAVGYENAATWGSTDGGQSAYGVVSKVQTLRDDPTSFLGSITMNVGIGDGRFRDFRTTTLPSGQVVLGKPRSNIGAFASAGLRLLPSTSMIADWGGQDLTVGLSIAPFPSFPLVLTPAMADVMQRANKTARFILGVGLGFRLVPLHQ